MNWLHFCQSILAKHHRSPQDAARAQHGLRLIREGLDILAPLGHNLHVADGPGPQIPLYPRLVFDINSHVREVYHPQDLVELGPGWYDSLEEARHEAGLNAQYTGRGGLPRGGLPMVIRQPNSEHSNGNP